MCLRWVRTVCSSHAVDFVVGKIPEWIGDLKELQILALSENKFEGKLRRGSKFVLLLRLDA